MPLDDAPIDTSEVAVPASVFDRVIATAVASAEANSALRREVQIMAEALTKNTDALADLSQQVGKLARLQSEREKREAKAEKAKEEGRKQWGDWLRTFGVRDVVWLVALLGSGLGLSNCDRLAAMVAPTAVEATVADHGDEVAP